VTRFEEFGANSGLIEELYQRYLADPASVDQHWRAFFAGEAPPPNGAGAGAAVPVAPPPPAPPAPEPTPPPGPLVLEGEEPEALRGAAARTVANMEASLGVPTATSVRTVPAKLLEVNRQILNNQLARTGAGKVSFTHLIAYAVVRALRDFPNLNSSYATDEGKPAVVRHQHVNLGLAVDVKRRDGAHSLLVPCVRHADKLDFAQFWAAYEELIAKVRGGTVSPDDFAGTTCTITNPGMIGTVHSVPRLMPGQGFIVGVGAIGYPAEYEGADPATLAKFSMPNSPLAISTTGLRSLGNFALALNAVRTRVPVSVGRSDCQPSSRISRRGVTPPFLKLSSPRRTLSCETSW
jgi:2-oxoglutarate dehydrogenase E1 component